MKSAASIVLAALLLVVSPMVVGASRANPVGKVLEMLSDMQAKITKEGEAAKKTYEELSAWCEDRSRNIGFEIKTAKAEVASLTAVIQKETATIASLNEKVESLASSIATDEADIKAAMEIRTSEATDFAAQEKELSEVIDTLGRAIAILEREMQKSGASMLQLRGASSIAKALDVLVKSSALNSADATRLTALVQGAQESAEGDTDASLGAPDSAVYKGHSGSIIDTLQELLEKAQGQLAKARSTETSNINAYEMLNQSLEDAVKAAKKEMGEAKALLEESTARKAAAEGDLDVTSKDLAADTKTLADLRQTCLTEAEEYEAATKSRSEELKALAAAQKAVAESTSGAAKLSYGLAQTSLLQLGRMASSSAMNLAGLEVVRFIRDLARKQGSTKLAQLAVRMASEKRLGTGEDIFAKIKGLITDMVEKLEKEADDDASHNAYCEKELAETKEKQEDKNAEISKLSTAIDKMTTRSAQLKDEVAELQKALSELQKAQLEMTKLRQEEHAEFVQNKADMEQGIEGVKLALKILREYYASDKAHSAAEGAGASIIGLLEVAESDFSRGLTERTAAEESAQASYDTETKENEIEKTAKEQDVKYKSKEANDLDKSVAEASSDRKNVQAELDAVLEYLETLKKQCVAKAETYAERKAAFEAELAGLKEALRMLEGQAVFLQTGARWALRDVKQH